MTAPDSTRLDHRIGDQFGVDTQILLTPEEGDHGLGNATDAYLERRPVLHERGHVLTDRARALLRWPHCRPLRRDPFIGFGAGRFHERFVDGHQDVQIEHAEEAVSQGPGHLRVHLGDHQTRVRSGRLDDVHGDAQAAATVDIGGSHLDERDIERDLSAGKEPGYVRKSDRRVVTVSLLDHVAHVRRHEERVHREVVGEFLESVGGLSEGQRLEHQQIGQRGVSGHERPHQPQGLGSSGADEHPLPRPDLRDRLLGGHDHLLVAALPFGVMVRGGCGSGAGCLPDRAGGNGADGVRISHHRSSQAPTGYARRPRPIPPPVLRP